MNTELNNQSALRESRAQPARREWSTPVITVLGLLETRGGLIQANFETMFLFGTAGMCTIGPSC